MHVSGRPTSLRTDRSATAETHEQTNDQQNQPNRVPFMAGSRDTPSIRPVLAKVLRPYGRDYQSTCRAPPTFTKGQVRCGKSWRTSRLGHETSIRNAAPTGQAGKHRARAVLAERVGSFTLSLALEWSCAAKGSSGFSSACISLSAFRRRRSTRVGAWTSNCWAGSLRLLPPRDDLEKPREIGSRKYIGWEPDPYSTDF